MLSMGLQEVLWAALVSVSVTGAQQDLPKKPSASVVRIDVNEKVLKLIHTWDSAVQFFTPDNRRITSLDALK